MEIKKNILLSMVIVKHEEGFEKLETSPTAAVAGDVWFNTASNMTEVYDGSQWKPIEQV